MTAKQKITPSSLQDAIENSPHVRVLDGSDAQEKLSQILSESGEPLAKPEKPKENEKVCFMLVAGNKQNKEWAEGLINMINHFHSDIPIHVFTDEHWNFEGDDLFRITPGIAVKLIQDYDLVIRLDADQLVLGALDHIIKSQYDVGCVLNHNKIDREKYGIITTYNIPPNLYVNAGLVAMRSKQFVHNWWALCNNPALFQTLQYREQDLLNILFHYNYPIYNNVIFDMPNDAAKYYAWHGLRAKGYGSLAEMRGDDVVIPKQENNDPDRDTVIKAYHYAGGGNEPDKMNYRIHFNDDVVKHIEKLRKGDGFESKNVIIGYGKGNA